MNTSKNNAGRLVMTEEAYFSSVAQKDCFNELDVEQYEIVATLDSHTSKICRSIDGKVFSMKDYQAGVTAPPFHVYCRSTTVPYFDDDFGSVGERAARNKDGNTYYVPADMNYQEWKKTFVDDGSKEGLKAVDKSFESENITGNDLTYNPDSGKMSVESKIQWLKKGKELTLEQKQELTAYADERKIKLIGLNKTDVDVSLMKEVIDDAEKMLAIYPDLNNNPQLPFTIKIVNGMSANDFAMTTSRKDRNIIQLNANAFRNKEKLAEEYQKLVDEKWFVQGTTYHSIIFHEIGHMYANIHKTDILKLTSDILKTHDMMYIEDYLKSYLSTYSVNGQNLATEIISEVFSAYYSNTENEFAKEFIERLKGGNYDSL